MSARTGQVTDEYDRPVPGATVYVYNLDGTDATLTSDGVTPLAQPVATDQFGTYTYWAADDYYREDTWYSGKLRYKEVLIVGNGNPAADLLLRHDLSLITGAALIGTADGDTVEQALANTKAKLAADRTYYVRADGSDSNTGLANTAGGAFLTIQKAIDTAYGLDLNGHQITISVGAGAYTGQISAIGALIGGSNAAEQPLQIIGDEVTPGNVVISTSGVAVNVVFGAYLLIAGVTIQTSGGQAIFCRKGTVEHRNIAFGNVAAEMFLAQDFALIKALGKTTVSGNADSFCHVTRHSLVYFTDQEINFSGNTFTTYVWGLNDATIALDGTTISGTRPSGATLVHDDSLLNTYSLVNAGGWGFLGTGSFALQDGGLVTSDKLAARQFYVRSDATSDNNDGGENTVARAFKTIQGCVNFIARLPYNAANYGNAKISIADGTYAETVTLADIKAYTYALIEGNLTTPANVIIAGVTDAIIAIGVRTRWDITGVKLNATSGSGIRAEQGSIINYGTVEFGSATNSQITATTNAVVTAIGNYTVTSSAPMHYQALLGARIDVTGRTVALSGANNFTSGFARVWSNATLDIENATFTASPVPTAVKYDLRSNGVIFTNGSGVTLPGSSAGTTATGGQYA